MMRTTVCQARVSQASPRFQRTSLKQELATGTEREQSSLSRSSLTCYNAATQPIASNLTTWTRLSIRSIQHPSPTPEEDQDNKPANAIKVFSYACKIAYPEEAAHVEHQLTLTHRHRNLLTETLLKGREKYREIIKEYLGLDIKALEEQAEEITTEIKAVHLEISDWKKQNRTTKPSQTCPTDYGI